MSADNISLAMISHGTDGSDGLERGIHLRVGVDRRKGIPASGFRIYRRYSYGNDKGEAVINFASSSPSVALPCGVKFSVGSESYSATLSSESIKSINTLMITIDGIQKQYVKLEGKYRIKFSTPVNKLKLDCFFNDGGDAEISVLYNGKIVEEQQYKDLNHQVYLTLKANKADELFINGIQRFYLGEIGFYTLEDDKKGWTGPINDKYGLGLPLNTTPEALFEIAKKSGELPAGIAPTLREFLRFIAGKDPDWLLSLLRLPKKQRAGFDEKEFKELKELMTDVMSDKQGLPADDFKYKDCEDNVDGSGISSSMSISPLSILLMSSLDPYIARVLGFYWNDATALPGKFYDYKVEADYPDGMLFNLGKYTDFSGFDGADSSIFNIGDYIF
ncbi:MAG TPA: hypothetical protein VHT96_16785 [Clostridia bacterium]|nr:hypothetical protein [Clostridia bacterium]